MRRSTPKSPGLSGSATSRQHLRKSSKCGCTDARMGALVSGSLGPPPMCMPMLVTRTAGSGSLSGAGVEADAGGTGAETVVSGSPCAADVDDFMADVTGADDGPGRAAGRCVVGGAAELEGALGLAHAEQSAAATAITRRDRVLIAVQASLALVRWQCPRATANRPAAAIHVHSTRAHHDVRSNATCSNGSMRASVSSANVPTSSHRPPSSRKATIARASKSTSHRNGTPIRA